MARQMKDSGIEWIGEIPEKWAVSKVKYFIDCYDGRRVPVDAGERVSGPYPYWGAGSITDYVDKYLFDEEVILLGEDGAPFFDPTRPVAFLVNEKIWVNNHIHVLKPHADVCPGYLLHFLNTVDYKTYINGSILNKLTQSNMNSIAFVVPSLPEQHRIADFLDRKCAEIDAVIEHTKATIEEYKKLKQAVITEAVTKGVRGARKMKDSGIEWIGEIPEEWEVTPLKYLITGYKAGPFGSALITDKLNPEGNILVYTPEHVAKKTAELEFNLYLPDERQEEMQQFIVTPGDIVFPIVGSLGRSMLVTNDMPMGIINQRLAKFRLSSHKLSIDYFMWLFSRSSFYSTYIDLNCRGSIIVNLTKQIVNDMPVPHPVRLDEQEGICDYLDEKCAVLDNLIAKKTALLTELETYKKTLIYEYVTGKKEVPYAKEAY